ncbi:hypothetical protein [Chryseobacterium gambrini]|uniref:Uncharacterized protein n=1 Tax=Chryseobacterium gambrini TaxID=373672 RepID=A0A1N7NQH3_9FLAO|nr:hypothetical protein [Chryseobacterium gambrini]SIT00633.1 hypothetical protein SAMN05421785_10512 [Chryseobacterium gambrini]
MKLKLSFLILSFFIFSTANAQIGIGKSTVTGSGILDFPTGTTKGIILPQVQDNSGMTNVSGGTFVFDGATSKVKYYNGTAWVDLTDQAGASKTLLAGTEQNRTSGVIIGAATSAARGVLVLESSNKALILPKVVDPATNVKSPSAGMMCYDPVAKLVCFYNGSNWAFWGNIE